MSDDKTMVNRASGVGMIGTKQCIRCNKRTVNGRIRRGIWHCMACVAELDAKAKARAEA